MAGAVLFGAPVENTLAGIITERALSGNQGPSLRCYGDVPRDSDGPGVREAHEETSTKVLLY